MNPLLPGIRVGDVLHGTRIFRRWWRAAVEGHAHRNVDEERRPKFLTQFALRRDDEFVVIVNAGAIFSVCNFRTTVMLPFINPTDKNVDYQRINPALFSTWFVRTNKRCIDRKLWPSKACLAWYYAQLAGPGTCPESIFLLNLYSGRSGSPLHWRPSQVFIFAERNLRSEEYNVLTRECLQGTVRTGLSRLPTQKNNSVTGGGGPHFGSGPIVGEISFLEAQVAELRQRAADFADRHKAVKAMLDQEKVKMVHKLAEQLPKLGQGAKVAKLAAKAKIAKPK